jgi:hypothetical protein
MRETFTSGSVGRAPGNRCLYPEPDRLQRPLHSRFRRRVSFGVRQRNSAESAYHRQWSKFGHIWSVFVSKSSGFGQDLPPLAVYIG